MATAAGFLRFARAVQNHETGSGTPPADIRCVPAARSGRAFRAFRNDSVARLTPVGDKSVLLTILGIEEMKTAADTAPKLTDAQKADVVMRLAGYELPRAIAKSMKEDFGIGITPQSIEFYDPTRYAGRACPERWATLFRETRAKLIEGKADIGAAHRMVRLRWLDQMARQQMDKGNTAEARALLKQAADETSRMAERREDGSDDRRDSKLSDAELHARIAAVAAETRTTRSSGWRLKQRLARGGAAEEPQPPGEPVIRMTVRCGARFIPSTSRSSPPGARTRSAA